MGLLNKISDFVTDEYEKEYYEENDYEDRPISKYENQKNQIRQSIKQTTMVLFEPRVFDEAKEIAEQLKEDKATVVNLHKLQRDYAQRTLDFLTGVVTALDGSIQKIGHNVVLCTPANVSVDGCIELSLEE